MIVTEKIEDDVEENKWQQKTATTVSTPADYRSDERTVTTITTSVSVDSGCNTNPPLKSILTNSSTENKDNDDESDGTKSRSSSVGSGGGGSISQQSTSVKKSVSFDPNYDSDLTKFTDGEEIVDKANPFKKFDFDNLTSVNLKFIKKNKLNKKSAIPTAVPKLSSIKSNELVKRVPESEYITKEEILRQSKYVPVYVKHPDRVLTYDKSIIHKLKQVESEVEEVPPPELTRVKRVPIPAPRKAVKPAHPVVAIIPPVKEVKKKRFLRSRNSKYPDLSQIRVKTGTEIEESLYDPNEVVINAIKFDSYLRHHKLKSDEDSDETNSGDSQERKQIV